MSKEIIINAGELESRVAILEEGQLAELHVEREPLVVGNIYQAKVVNVLPGMDAAFADIGLEKNAFLSASDVIFEGEEVAPEEEGKGASITRLLRNGQEILVQVVRAALGTKGARVTTRLALPGRYLVLLLTNGGYVGVSRKIENQRERQRLRKLGEELRPQQFSLIVRTEADGRGRRELKNDLDFLLQLAARIEDKGNSVNAPTLVYEDLTLIYRLIRDVFTRQVKQVLVDSPSVYQDTLELVELIAPHLKSRVKLYTDKTPIFTKYDIESEIERLLSRRVRLPSGGHITIDQAEALTAIDVNTGRYVGSNRLAQTVLQTNLEAAQEIARQLRLRDVGGLIVIDFIDMDRAAHRDKVFRTYQEALSKDRSKVKLVRFSALGLMEMTRKRIGKNLGELLCESCPYCQGRGRVRSPLTMALAIEREMAAMDLGAEAECLVVWAHPRVAALLVGFEGQQAEATEQSMGRPIYIRGQEGVHLEDFQIIPTTERELSQHARVLRRGQRLEAQILEPDTRLTNKFLALVDGYHIGVEAPAEAGQSQQQIRMTKVGHSYGEAVVTHPRRPARPKPK